jgi:alpha-1,2-mannosyltransferase
VRIFGLGRWPTLAGLGLSAVVAALGVWAAVEWHRHGAVRLAVTLCGVGSLLASPVSWLHHFVWVLPLALCLLEGTRLDPGLTGSDRGRGSRPPLLPTWYRVLGWLFIAWVVVSPFRSLPNGADIELTWTWRQNAVATLTAALGIALLVSSILVAKRRRSLHESERLVQVRGRSHRRS